jgi:serine/threonine protein kinase
MHPARGAPPTKYTDTAKMFRITRQESGYHSDSYGPPSPSGTSDVAMGPEPCGLWHSPIVRNTGLGGGAQAQLRLIETHDGSKYAAKIFHDPLAMERERFVYEKLGNHPCFPSYHGLKEVMAEGMPGQAPCGSTALVLELVEGPTVTQFLRGLHDMCQRRGPTVRGQPELIALIGKQLFEGLAHLEQLRICHRDVKPDNLMLDAKGQLKILDFGVAVRTDSTKLHLRGTLPFVAPELLTRPAEPASSAGGGIDHAKADVYSAANVLLFGLTGLVLGPDYREVAELKRYGRDESVAIAFALRNGPQHVAHTADGQREDAMLARVGSEQAPWHRDTLTQAMTGLLSTFLHADLPGRPTPLQASEQWRQLIHRHLSPAGADDAAHLFQLCTRYGQEHGLGSGEPAAWEAGQRKYSLENRAEIERQRARAAQWQETRALMGQAASGEAA